jgi:hypothetical protein
MDSLPVAYTPGPSALKARREGLLADLVRRSDRREDLTDGHRLRFGASGEIVNLIARAIDAERHCCRFLRFRLTVEPDEAPRVALSLQSPQNADKVRI